MPRIPESVAKHGIAKHGIIQQRTIKAKMAALRRIREKADVFIKRSRDLAPGSGTMGIGCEDVREFQVGEVLCEFLRCLAKHDSPDDARDAAANYGIEIGKKWNSSGYKSRASFSDKHALMITDGSHDKQPFPELDWAWRLVISSLLGDAR